MHSSRTNSPIATFHFPERNRLHAVIREISFAFNIRFWVYCTDKCHAKLEAAILNDVQVSGVKQQDHMI